MYTLLLLLIYLAFISLGLPFSSGFCLAGDAQGFSGCRCLMRVW